MKRDEKGEGLLSEYGKGRCVGTNGGENEREGLEEEALKRWC